MHSMYICTDAQCEKDLLSIKVRSNIQAVCVCMCVCMCVCIFQFMCDIYVLKGAFCVDCGTYTCTDTRTLTLLHGFWCNLVHHSAYLSVVPRIIVRLQGPFQSGLVRFLKLWILERLLPADVSAREPRPWSS